MLVTWKHKELIGLRGESDVALKGKGRIYHNICSCTSSSSNWIYCFTKCLSIAFCCCSYCTVLFWLCIFPDTVGVQNLETVELFFVNYLPQICMQKNGKSFGRHDLTCVLAVPHCARYRNELNVWISATEQLTKGRRQSLWLHLEHKL